MNKEFWTDSRATDIRSREFPESPLTLGSSVIIALRATISVLVTSNRRSWVRIISLMFFLTFLQKYCLWNCWIFRHTTIVVFESHQTTRYSSTMIKVQEINIDQAKQRSALSPSVSLKYVLPPSLFQTLSGVIFKALVAASPLFLMFFNLIECVFWAITQTPKIAFLSDRTSVSKFRGVKRFEHEQFVNGIGILLTLLCFQEACISSCQSLDRTNFDLSKACVRKEGICYPFLKHHLLLNDNHKTVEGKEQQHSSQELAAIWSIVFLFITKDYYFFIWIQIRDWSQCIYIIKCKYNHSTKIRRNAISISNTFYSIEVELEKFFSWMYYFHANKLTNVRAAIKDGLVIAISISGTFSWVVSTPSCNSITISSISRNVVKTDSSTKLDWVSIESGLDNGDGGA